MNINNTRILIIGGTGSWGQALTRLLLTEDQPAEIVIYSRAERTQFEMSEKFQDKRLRFEIGDVRDKERLNEVMAGVDIVLHLAALKHVPICEYNPIEAIKTNINGLQNSIECAIQNEVSFFVYLSTDKAVEPINSYGMTKAIAEKLVQSAAQKPSATDFVIVRAGNVIGTNGSILPKMIGQAKETGKITVTHPEMTRFMVRLDDAVRFLSTSVNLQGIQILSMKCFKIQDLAELVQERFGGEIVYTGIRTGEKLYEKLDINGLASYDNVSSKEELKEMIKEWLV
jgi:FlaA1/EpsC-like NDP-sugar epimerase